MHQSLIRTCHFVMRFAFSFAVCSLPAALSAADSVEDCVAQNGVTPICGFQNPEDLEVMSGGKLILVSEYGGSTGAKPGYLSSYKTSDGAIKRLFPAAASSATPANDNEQWGDKTCPGPIGSEFAPHGISHTETGGLDRLLVVNHGMRESIEFFEIALDEDGTAVELHWRGCVVAPPDVWINDVVALPDGAFAVSNMMPRSTSASAISAMEMSQEKLGGILEWRPRQAWRALEGSAGSLPNGIEASPDGSILYINYYFGNEVVAYDRATQSRLWASAVQKPDNSSWSPHGELLVAAHDVAFDEVMACAEHAGAYCDLRYSVVAIDPKDGSQRTLFSGAGAPFAAATVAVQIGSRYYLGTYSGSRIAYRDEPK